LDLGLPGVVKSIKNIASGKYIPSSKGESQALYEAGKELGLSDKQLAPITATEGQVARHGKLAATSSKTKESFKETHDALSDLFEEIKTKNTTPFSNKVESDLLDAIIDIENGIQKGTHALSPEELASLNFIQKVRKDIANGGSDASTLIGTYRSINKLKEGKTAASKLKEPIQKALDAADPVLGKEFSYLNKIYARYQKNLGEVSPKAYAAFVDAGEFNQFVSSAFTGNIPKGLAQAAYYKALKGVSRMIITNPRAQSIVRNFGKAVKTGKASLAEKSFEELREFVKKEDPDAYKDIPWDEIYSNR
jgi:hypothetical protein